MDNRDTTGNGRRKVRRSIAEAPRGSDTERKRQASAETDVRPTKKNRPVYADDRSERKKRSVSAEGHPAVKRRSQDARDAVRRQRLAEEAKRAARSQSAERKIRPEEAKRAARPQSAESTERRRRPKGAESTERKIRPEEAKRAARSQTAESTERRRRPKSAEGTERRRRPEGAESARRRKSADSAGRTSRPKKKRTYLDVLNDLVVDTSVLALLIKGLFCLLLFIIVLFVARGIRNKSKVPRQDVNANIEADESNLSTAQTDLQRKTDSFLKAGAGAQEENSITILGVGDNLVHEQVFLTAQTDDGYDFRPFYSNVKDFISSADLATVNQETPLATALGSASGYPHFNTPTEMGDALIDAGFDVANMGNNHMFDMGVDGAYVTREYWDEKNIPCTGFYYGYDDLFDYRIIEKNGIKVAFLSFVEMTNDELPSDYSAFVVYMNDPDLVKSMLEEAKEKADIVVVHAHWGDENTDVTNDYVYDEAQKLVNWGADIVFGNHSHVVQDLVTLTRESDGQKCPVIYSLGNFFSAQKVRDQLVSGMLTVQVTKDPSGKVRPSAMGFLPIVTHYTGDRNNLSLYPLSMYSEEMAAMHGTASVSTEGMPMSMEYIESLLEKHIPTQYLGKMGPIEQGSN